MYDIAKFYAALEAVRAAQSTLANTYARAAMLAPPTERYHLMEAIRATDLARDNTDARLRALAITLNQERPTTA